MPEERKKKSGFGFLGIDPTLGLGDKVLNHIEEAEEEEMERIEKSDYYALCPNCGKKQIKENLLESGCFVCGWKGTEEDIELTKVRRQAMGSSFSLRRKELGYKTNCPNCGVLVITEEFLKNGCWRCGYKG